MTAVSAIIPTYNGTSFLGAAIDSVLSQTFTDLELIVVDDGSTDDTPELVKRYGGKLRYVRQPNQGVAAARNHGIEASAAEFVAFLDSDDTWLPRKVELQVAALRARPGFRGCTTAHQLVDAQLRPIKVVQSDAAVITLEMLLFRGNVMGSVSSMLCERTLIAEVGGFERRLSQCADWDMWIRLVKRGAFLSLEEPLVTYRWHDSNMSLDPALLEADSIKVLTRAFEAPDIPSEVVRRKHEAFAHVYTVLAGSYWHAGRYGDFLRSACRALVLHPQEARYIAAYPMRLAARLRGGEGPRPWPWSQGVRR